MIVTTNLKFLSLATKIEPRLLYRWNSTLTDSKRKDEVIFEESDTTGSIILNRPKALNSLNLSMSEQIHTALRQWESTKNLVIIRSSSDKAFCSGGDLQKGYQELMKEGGEKYTRRLLHNEYTVSYLIATYKKPYIALINGITMGAGAGLSIHGQYRIATEKTLFAMPEAAIGLYPDNGSTYFLPRLRGQLGIYLGLTGRCLKGVDVKLAGLATHYVMSNQIHNLTDELVDSGGKDIEQILNAYADPSTAEFSLTRYTDKIDEYFSAGSVEEIVDRLKNDGDDWAMRVLEDLRRMSPTSLKLGHKTMNKGRGLSLAECLKMEYRLANTVVSKEADICEGIRARVIDKNYKPAWKPRTLEEVTDEYIEGLLNVVPDDGDLLLWGVK